MHEHVHVAAGEGTFVAATVTVTKRPTASEGFALRTPTNKNEQHNVTSTRSLLLRKLASLIVIANTMLQCFVVISQVVPSEKSTWPTKKEKSAIPPTTQAPSKSQLAGLVSSCTTPSFSMDV